MNRYEYGEYDDDEQSPLLETCGSSGEESEEEMASPVPLGLSLRYGLGTFVGMGLLDLIAHFGPTGLVVGGIAAYAASRHGPDLVEHLREALPAPVARRLGERPRSGCRSHPRVRDRQARAFEDDEDTLLVEEEDDDLEALTLPDTLALGSLRPHADLLFSHRVVALGMPGSGKSNLVAVLVEELGQYDAPLLVFDHKPEYGPLCRSPYLSNPVRLSASVLTPQNAAETAGRLMAERWQAVLDLSSYPSDAQAAYVMTELIAGVLRYQKGRTDTGRLPCTFVLDEAHYWLPEHEGHSTIRGTKLRTGQTLLSYVQQAFFTLAKLGRSFGMGLIVATQRPADVDKRLISAADWRFLLQTLEPTDLKVYRSYGLADEVAMALDPKRGEAYVIGPDGVRGLVHIRRRSSPDVAKSPGLDNIRRATSTSDSPIHPSPAGGRFERPDVPVYGESVNSEWPVNRPGQPVYGGELSGESSPVPVNPVKAEADEEQAGYSHVEEMQVILAYTELVKAAHPGDPPITRTAIMRHLGWNTKHYQRIIKPVCDKHGIAL